MTIHTYIHWYEVGMLKISEAVGEIGNLFSTLRPIGRKRDTVCTNKQKTRPCQFNNSNSDTDICTRSFSLSSSMYTHSKSMDQPDKVVNPARGQLNKENEYFPVLVRA